MNAISRPAHIAHVLFIDIVGYSRQSISAQGVTLQSLNAAVNASSTFQEARQANAVHPLPPGDGMALLFFNDVIAPARCAVDIGQTLQSSDPLPVRMGIHSGLVQKQLDIAGRENVVGEGINTAQRVMDFGEAGHILLSLQYAIWLKQFDPWQPLVHPVGEGIAKHEQKVQVYSLHGKGFGRADMPAKLKAKPGASDTPSIATAAGIPPQKVALLYKPNQQPDEAVLRTLEVQLREHGHTVFVDNQTKISAQWARAVEAPIRASDAVIAIVSPKSMQSEMLEFEIETAQDQHAKTGKPILLPVQIGDGEPLEGVIAALIQPLPTYHWHGPQNDQKLVTELLSAIHEPLKLRPQEVKLEPVGGAVPPDSPFYVPRTADAEFHQALSNGESILLVKGARQMGKTSLLARGAKQAKELGWRVGMTDFQKLNSAQMNSEDLFYKLLAATLARQMKFHYDFENEWLDLFGSNLNIENFLRELLDASEERLVWCMDEVDKLFLAPFASDFFGLVRSWHNSRSTEADGPWSKLTVIISYATEAHLFIQDLNQSPFNVGRRLDLQEFNAQQVVDLNGRYGGPLSSYQDVERLQALIGGQPFLTRRALDALATGKYDFPSLLEQADRDDGPFNDHLKRILVSVSRLPEVLEYVKGLLHENPPADQDAYYRLLAAGIIRETTAGQSGFRCELYRRHLQHHLL